MKPTCIIFDTSRETSITMHSDNWVSETHMVFMTHIFRNVQKVLNLLWFLNLSNTKDLTFGFISKEGEIQKFPLDKELNTSLLWFLQQTNSEESQKQDCMQFLKWLIWQWQISDNEIKLDNYYECKIDDILPNWIILLISKSWHHWAVYLWKWIYLSRFWAGSPIWWASLEQLMQIYKPDEIIVWNKKN